MLKRVLLLSLLTQLNLISSEPETSENTDNTRATRQLNFGDCCPCPEQDAFQDQGSADSRRDPVSVDDPSCPCRSTSDSEGASSIFRPAFRAIEPYTRAASKKETPKPLLNPEVGLASSVLETLREVTDQEYQEALVRDAARSALQFLDPEQLQSEPKNFVNIIVSPKDINNDDILSEASEIQGSTCMLPSSNMNNNFERLHLQPPTNILKHILSPPKFSNNGILNRNRSDMDGSASNIESQKSPPLKSIFLENMKTRLNSLKRPFPNTDNRNFLTSPNILQKYNLKNNIKDRILSRNRPLHVQSNYPNNFKELFENNAADNKKLNMGPHEVHDFNRDATVTIGNSARKMKITNEDNKLYNTDCIKTSTAPNPPIKENSEDFDVVPSSSKVIEIENRDITENFDIIKQEGQNELLDMDTDTNNFSPITLESVTQQYSSSMSDQEPSEVITENSNVANIHTDIQTEIVTENTTEPLENNIKDMESESTVNRNILNLQDDTCTGSSNEDENISKSAYPNTFKDERNQKPLFINSLEKHPTDPKTSTLPNIKADIFRTLDSFKKANEKIQEKLRSNVKDALQQAIINKPYHSIDEKVFEPQSEKGAISAEQPQNNASVEKNVSTQDLQKMSDSLLELSSLKDNIENSNVTVDKADSVEELHNKPIKVEKESYIDDMITLPTTLDSKRNVINLQNNNLISNVKNHYEDSKKDKIEEKFCTDNVSSRNSGSRKTNSEDSEMIAQPSDSVLKSISQQILNPSKLGFLQKDFPVQPVDIAQPIEGIKEFFNSFVDEDLTDDDTQSYRFNNDKNIDPSNSFSIGTSNMPKYRSGSNLSSYKAKVVSPKSLDINQIRSTVPNSDDEVDVLGFESQKMPQSTNNRHVVKNNLDNKRNPLFKRLQTPQMFQDTFSSIPPKLSESFTSHTSNALKKIQDSLNMARGEPFTKYKHNLLGKPLINPDNIFDTAFKTHEDFNDKVQAFHSDLNRRLSAISSRTLLDGSKLQWSPSRLKTSTKNRVTESHAVPKKIAKSPTVKNSLLLKNIASMESNKRKHIGPTSRSNKADILRSNIKEKLEILSQQKDLSSKREPMAIKSPKSKMKLKPLKENKVTISFATTSIRPETLKSKLNPLYQIDSLRSRSTGSLAKLPKLSNNLEDKLNPTLKFKLKSNDPKVMASEIATSRTALPESAHKSKISQDSSAIEESGRLHNENMNTDRDRGSGSILDVNKRKTSLLSKLKRPILNGAIRGNTNINNKVFKESEFDATRSASSNIDTISATSLVAERTKDKNQSFKCKMVCIQDILDSTDTRRK